MSLVFAWMLALAAAAPSPATVGDRSAAADPEAPVSVPIDIGPPLVRNMGLVLTVRRAGDDPVMHRPVDVHEVPRPAYSDDPPPPLRIELAPGEYVIEAEAQGFLPSTRAVSVRAGASVGGWQFLPDSAHRTVRFAVVAAHGDLPVSLTARHLADEQAPVSCTARRVPCEFRLQRGEWELQAAAPGHRPLQRRVTVGDAEAQSVDLALQTGIVEAPRPVGPVGPVVPAAQPAPTHERRRLVLGLSLAAVPLLAAGLPLSVVGPLRFRQLRNSALCDSYGATCADVIIPQIHVGSAGAGLLGAALGLGAGAVAAARTHGNTAWWVELSVGSALTVAGGAWLVTNSILLDRELKTGPLADIDARTARRPGSSLLLGAGLGLTGGAVTGLLLRRSPRAARLGPLGGPGQVGVLLSGEF